MEIEQAFETGTLSGLSPRQVRWCAEQYVMERYRSSQRASALISERKAMRSVQPVEPPSLDAGGYLRALGSIVDDAIEAYAKRISVDWDAIASTPIAMPDGTSTTWGTATLDQHRARYTMLRANASSNLEAASRHLLAIRKLEASGASALAA